MTPERTPSYIALARIYFSQGNLEAIEKLYQQGIDANPQNVTLRMELALRLQSRGEYQQSLDLLEEAYAIDSSSQPILNNLSALLLDHFPSEENLRRVQELTLGFEDSKAPALLDTLGWLHYKLGNFPQSISLLEAAQAAGGQGTDYSYHLGMAYYKSGQPEKAKEQLSLALEQMPEDYHGRAEAELTYKSL